MGKSKLLFLIHEEKGEQFGYYLSTQIVETIGYQHVPTDKQSFHFNIQSTFDRLQNPIKFDIVDIEKGGYCLFNQSDISLLTIGDIWLYKKKDRKDCSCSEDTTHFNYNSIQHALCGKNPYSNSITFFNPKRILVIQMI